MIDIRLRRNHRPEEEENYFASMTDMMVGMVFIFIIVLAAFALNYKTAENEQDQSLESIRDAVEKIDQEIDEISRVEEQRARLLQEIKRRLRKENVRVSIDVRSGVLRFPGEFLFGHAKYELNEEGRRAIGVLGVALEEVLPCFANLSGLQRRQNCEASEEFTVEAVFVEGHTDHTGPEPANWELSTQRAISAYDELKKGSPELAGLRNSEDQYLFSVSGYAWHRPRPDIPDVPGAKEPRNRRIDLRFIMAFSHEKALERIKGELENILQQNQ